MGRTSTAVPVGVPEGGEREVLSFQERSSASPGGEKVFFPQAPVVHENPDSQKGHKPPPLARSLAAVRRTAPHLTCGFICTY